MRKILLSMVPSMLIQQDTVAETEVVEEGQDMPAVVIVPVEVAVEPVEQPGVVPEVGVLALMAAMALILAKVAEAFYV
jgi:hypothetical protein